MYIVFDIFRLINFKAFEVRIQYKLLSRDHFVCSNGYNSALLIDAVHKYAESIKFSEIFSFHYILKALQDNLFVLACEVLIHFAYFIHEL